MSTISYFGYGAMANRAIMTALLGRTPHFEVRNSAIRGWGLVTQNLSDIPNAARMHDGVEINPQQLMREIWGEDFRSYTIIPRQEGTVYGILWEGLTDPEDELLKEWQLIQWGWYKNIPDVVVSAGGTRVTGCRTECIGDNQGFDDSAPFLTWSSPPPLVDVDRVVVHAYKVGEEFRSR